MMLAMPTAYQKKTLPTKYCGTRNRLLQQFMSSWRITDTCKLYIGERKKSLFACILKTLDIAELSLAKYL